MAYKPGTGPGSPTFGSRRDKIGEDLTKASKVALETFTPLGDIQTAKDAYAAYQRGDIGEAALNSALIALGYTPLGPLARPAGRLAKRVARDKDMLIPALTDKDYADLVARETIMGKGPLAGKSVGAATADTMKDYTTTQGYNPLDLLLMQRKGIDPATHEIYYHGTTKPEAARSIVEDRIKTPNHMITGDPMVALQYTKAGPDEPYKGAIVGYPVKKGEIDKYRDAKPISNSRDERANRREQYNVPSIELEKIMGDPFMVENPTQFRDNRETAISMLDDYYKSFMKK
jgi:hypothetical protein